MTRKKLVQIRYLNTELELLREEQKELEERIDSMGRWPDGMPRSGKVGDPIGDLATEIVKRRELLNKKELEVLQTGNEIIEYINTITDSKTRQIVYLRCIKGLSWDMIAKALPGTTDKSVKKVFYRLEK